MAIVGAADADLGQVAPPAVLNTNMLVLIEAVRQVRGECDKCLVPNCNIALAHGNSSVLSSQCTVILGGAATLCFR